jgi:hypothetical protein
MTEHGRDRPGRQDRTARSRIGPGQPGPARLSVRAVPAALLALAFVMALAWGCALAPLPQGFAPPQARKVIPGVPFHPQTEYQCGPASLAGVLNFLGDPVTPEEIADAVFRKDLRGSVSLDLALYPRDRGFATRFWRGGVADLIAAVDAGTPLVVMIDQGIGPVGLGHFMVVVGYAPGGIVVNSGRERETVMAWRTFLPMWDRAADWTLAVTRGAGTAPGAAGSPGSPEPPGPRVQ